VTAPVTAPPPRAGARAEHAGRGPRPGGTRAGRDRLVLPLLVLLVAAALPLVRVFIGLDFLRPVLAAALLSVGVSWVARRLGSGPIIALLGSLFAWAVFITLVFLPDTAAYGFLPTRATAAGVHDLWLQAVELIRTRPAPAYPEAGLLLLTATGVWWTAHAVDVLLFRLQAPLRAIGMALVLWTVPLALHRGDAVAWVWAAPFLAAAAWLLLAAGGDDRQRVGARAVGRHARSGALVAAAAIVAGALVAGWLPGFGAPPYYRFQGLSGGSTLTTNPIVTIRDNLVRTGSAPVARVETSQPVYLRLTSLDRYDASEQWRSEGISGGPAGGTLPFEAEPGPYRELEVDITPEGLDGAVLVPAPYHPLRLAGPAAERFFFDADNATITLGERHGLGPEEPYTVTAAIPDPDAATLAGAPVAEAEAALTALPRNVPDEVAALATEIVAAAGAESPFEQALAIQNELRTWTYSLEPPAGHSSSAMLDFIDNRVGYCEQYAGTMAVMLRTLGIPTRVAVGYTPGEVIAEDGDRATYLVTRENAHAWVEVLFPGTGWLAFEPTPRDDGNVLAPSASNLAPTELVADTDPEDLPEELGALEEPDSLVPELEDAPADGQPDGGAASAPEDEAGPGPWLWVSTGIALGALAAAAAAKGSRRQRRTRLADRERVLAAADRVRHTGRGLGVAPRAAETDREYLARLVSSAPSGGNGGPAMQSRAVVEPARALAATAARARYAPALEADDARSAEAAEARLVASLLGPQPLWRRALVRVRASAGAALDGVRARRS
jgi:hypothetical protein